MSSSKLAEFRKLGWSERNSKASRRCDNGKSLWSSHYPSYFSFSFSFLFFLLLLLFSSFTARVWIARALIISATFGVNKEALNIWVPRLSERCSSHGDNEISTLREKRRVGVSLFNVNSLGKMRDKMNKANVGTFCALSCHCVNEVPFFLSIGCGKLREPVAGKRKRFSTCLKATKEKKREQSVSLLHFRLRNN